jgi:hypothetical protein
VSNAAIRDARDCELLLFPREPLVAGDLVSAVENLSSEMTLLSARGYIQGSHKVLAVGLGFDPDPPLTHQFDEQLRLLEGSMRESLEAMTGPDPGSPDLGDGSENEPPLPGSDDEGQPPVSSLGPRDRTSGQAAFLEAIADDEQFLTAIRARAIVLHVLRFQRNSDLTDQELAGLRLWGDLLPVAVNQWPLGVEAPVGPKDVRGD